MKSKMIPFPPLRFKRNMFKIENKSTRNQFMEISNALVSIQSR